MKRIKNNSPQARRNRNNRKRGSAFEKKVADILDMYAVPYSGTNSRFGWGDIRDHECKSMATWLGECKNITVKPEETTITIKREWIDKNNERANEIGCLSFIAFMQAGRANKYILIDDNVMTKISQLMGDNEPACDANRVYKKKVHNTKNLIIPLSDLNLVKNRMNTIRLMNEGDEIGYYLMDINAFKNAINEVKLHAKYDTDTNNRYRG